MVKHTQTIRRLLSTNCLSVFDHFVGLALKGLIIALTRVTVGSSTIIDRVLASFPEKITQSGALGIGLSDHQTIYYTRKISKIKRGSHKQIKFCLFKQYTVDLFEQELSKLNLPNYNDMNEAYF